MRRTEKCMQKYSSQFDRYHVSGRIVRIVRVEHIVHIV